MSWYKNEVVAPNRKEVVYEIVTKDDNVGFGLAVAVIEESAPHHHGRTRETYTLIEGKLEVHCGDDVHILEQPGQSIEIPIGVIHWARHIGNIPAHVTVLTIPAWTLQDHIANGAA